MFCTLITIKKCFITNLYKHKHSIRSGHLVYWCRNTATKSSDELTLKKSIYIIIISIIYIIIYIIKKIQQWIKEYSKVERDAFEWYCITYKILNSLIAPRDSTYLLARLKYFTQQTYSCIISETLQNIFTETQNRRPNNVQKTSAQSYKIQIKILLFPRGFC